jgi:hypothetical protein
MGDLIKYGLLAVGGYLLYTNFISQPAGTVSAAPAASGGGAPPTPPPTTPAPTGNPATIAALNTWAATQPGFTGTFSSDVWHWAWTQVLKKPPIPDADFFVLWPGGTPPMTAAAFVNAAATRGLSGLGLTVLRHRIPLRIPAPAAGAIALAMAKRRSGIQNYTLRGAPMPKGMR